MEPNAEVPQTRPIKDIDLGCTTRFRCNSAELCLLVLGLSAVFGMGMGSCYLFLTPNCPVCPPCPRAPECSLACPSCTCNYQAHDTCVCPAPVICSTEKPTTTANMTKKRCYTSKSRATPTQNQGVMEKNTTPMNKIRAS